MLLPRSQAKAVFAYPVAATAAVALFLLRNRQIAGGASPGSGVSIAGFELVARLSALVRGATSVVEAGFGLLLRIATAPPHLALAALQSEFRLAESIVERLASLLNLAVAHLPHVL